MTPQAETIHQLKVDALAAGASGVLIIRGIHKPQLMFEAIWEGLAPSEESQGHNLYLELDGKMLLIAVFPETDGQPAGIES